MELPKKKYQVIYADPPWRYNFSKDNKDKIEEHYPTMGLEEIKKISVNIIADDNCVLFLWATAPKLKEALEVMDSWGFEYKTNAVWDKQWIGMGYWFRGNHELLLVGTKGKFSPPNQKELVDSVFRIRRREHSRKPDKIRTLIWNWFRDFDKIELFARQKIEGWDCWGNEVPTEEQKTIKGEYLTN